MEGEDGADTVNYADKLFTDFVNSSEGYSRFILDSALRSNEPNSLKTHALETIANKLRSDVLKKVYNFNLTITENLTSAQEKELSDNFSEINIKFTRTNNNSHSFSAASRKCERMILLSRAGYNNAFDSIQVKDVGGNFVTSVLKGERYVHSCSPILDSYDCSRLTTRIVTAANALKETMTTPFQREKLKEFLKDAPLNKSSSHYCFDKAQLCKVKCSTLIFLHSCYDIPLTDLGNIMDSSDAMVGYGSFIYSSQILTDDVGTIPAVNATFRIQRWGNKRRKIYFGFDNDAGFNYEHDFSTYISYVTQSSFNSTKGNRFVLELMENRNGIQFFKVLRIHSKVKYKGMTHRLPLTHLRNKYMVRFPELHYDDSFSSYTMPTNLEHNSKNVYIKDKASFWRYLPRGKFTWIVVYVDKDIIDRTCAFVLGATEEKFKPEQIVSYLRSCFTHIISGNTITEKNDLPSPQKLNAIAHAIYLTLYDTKFKFGKLLQQAIININSNRQGNFYKDVLEDFRDEGCFLVRFVKKIFGVNVDIPLNPENFITEVPEYIEIKGGIIYPSKTADGKNTDEIIKIINTNLITFEEMIKRDAHSYFKPKTESAEEEKTTPSSDSEPTKEEKERSQFETKPESTEEEKEDSSYSSCDEADSDTNSETSSDFVSLDDDDFFSSVMKAAKSVDPDLFDEGIEAFEDETERKSHVQQESDSAETEETPTFLERDSVETEPVVPLFSHLEEEPIISPPPSFEDNTEEEVETKSSSDYNECTNFSSWAEVVENDLCDYPSLGVYEAEKNRISVDPRMNECCLLAATENRCTDLDSLRTLLKKNNPKPSVDFLEELQPGNTAGYAVLEICANVFNYSYIIHNEYSGPPIKITKPNSVRNVSLTLENNHYYLMNSCRENYDIEVRRDKLVYAISPIKILSKLRKHFEIGTLLENSSSLKSDLFGYHLYNNLSKYCNVHSQCRNNRLYCFLNTYVNLKMSAKIFLMFEKINFDPTYADYVFGLYPSVGFVYVDYSHPEVFVGYVFPKDERITKNFFECHEEVLNHKCGKGKYVRMDDKINFVHTCSKETHRSDVIRSNYNIPEVTIEIKQNDCNVSTKEVTKNSLIVCTPGESTMSDVITVEKFVVDFLSSFSRISTTLVTTNYTNIMRIMNSIKTKSDFVFLDSRAIEVNQSFVIYLPATSDNNRAKNSMMEQLNLWSLEKKTAERQLHDYYSRIVDAVQNRKRFDVIDNTLVLVDTLKKKFVYGIKFEKNYQWGFSNGKLINTENLFENGKINRDVATELSKQGHQYILFNQKSKLLHGVKLVNMFSPNEVTVFNLPEVTFVRGVPGAGKTEYILRNNVGKRKNLILTVTREAKEDMVKRMQVLKKDFPIKQIKTIDSYLLNDCSSGYEEVWIDEALLVHVGQWYWVAHASGCKSLIVVGDSAQIPYINRDGASVNYSLPNISFKEEFLKTNHRNPLDIVYWLHKSKFYPFDVKGTSEHSNSVSLKYITGPEQIPRGDDIIYLTFTQTEKDKVSSMGLQCNTIHEYQGNQSNNIVLVRLEIKDAFTIYKSKPHILVALTRHRRTFTYCTVNRNDDTSNIVNEIMMYSPSLYKTVSSLRGGGFGRRVVPDRSVTLYLEDKKKREVVLQYDSGGYVPWYFEKNYDFNEDETYEYTGCFSSPINAIQCFIDYAQPDSTISFNEYDHYNFEYQDFKLDGPVKLRASLPIFKKYSNLTPQIRSSIQQPLHMSQKLNLKAFYERNGCVPQLQGFIDDFHEAKELFTDFKKLLKNDQFNFSSHPIVPNIKSFDEWTKKQPPSIIKMIEGDGLFQDQDLTVYDFIIKAIPKIDLEYGSHLRYKSPQTIAYQKKVINGLFCPLLKDFMDRVEYTMNDNVLLYNNMSPNDFAKLLTEKFPLEKQKQLSKFLEIDFSKYDKSQGLVVLILEMFLLEFYGVPNKFIVMWVIMHRLTYLVDKVNGFSAIVEYQRKSGDAGTWRFNTLIQIAVLNRVYRLSSLFNSDRCLGCFSGDDSVIFLEREIVDIENRTRKLPQLYNLEAKIMNFKIPYFCSKFLLFESDSWIFVPDAIKLCVKLGRHDIVDENHAECYRISFNDNLYYYKNPNNWAKISLAINDRYKLKGDHSFVFQALLSISSKSENFKKLYYEGIGFKRGTFTTYKSLDI